ncbi:MAG TPA: hypothetical protein VER11_34530 [Polyangiaceae bacterium]|nr:hypothetical protein [Polyangiaceae bacterium]
MALETKRVTIGGSQYAITQLGAVAGRGLFKKFVTAMSPLLRDAVSGSVFKDLQKLIGELPEGETFDKLAIAVAPIVGPYLIRTIEDLPQDLFEELCETFSQSTTVLAGKPATPQKLSDLFDEHFAGKYVDMIGWLFQCLKVNGFLAKLGSAASAAQPEPTA